jgi:hypothetical protein
MNGKIFRATIANSIGGAPVVDFNPNQYNAATSQTQWTSSTGEVWTINTGTAATGYKGVLVDRTILQFNKSTNKMQGSNDTAINNALSNNHSIAFVAKNFTSQFGGFVQNGGYTENNAIQVFVGTGGSSVNVGRWIRGTANNNQDSTGVITPAKTFSYVDSIVYGGTSVQRVNETSNSGSYFNGTTQKPNISANANPATKISDSGFGDFNGVFNTYIVANNPTKYLELQTIVRTINNNFAL